MDQFIILGAGVIGLTTALVLKDRFPDSHVVIIAKHIPGDRDPNYTSPCAGAHWMSYATDNGIEEVRDAITYRRFGKLRERYGDAVGIYPIQQRCLFDQPAGESGIWSKGTRKVWFDTLVPGGLRPLSKNELPDGVIFGYDFATYVIDTQIYLSWILSTALARGCTIHRGMLTSLNEAFKLFPYAKAFFNCTGLGSRTLKGVEDKALYPTRGQILLVQGPERPIDRLYNRAAWHLGEEGTYIFPRGKSGGIILGGCFQPNNSSEESDHASSERIKTRCCKLCPELGKPEDLKVLATSVGLRPTRYGGARIEQEMVCGKLVVHAYGFGGCGYQASWGAAEEAVDLIVLKPRARL